LRRTPSDEYLEAVAIVFDTRPGSCDPDVAKAMLRDFERQKRTYHGLRRFNCMGSHEAMQTVCEYSNGRFVLTVHNGRIKTRWAKL